jgi:hypothetical protein
MPNPKAKKTAAKPSAKGANAALPKRLAESFALGAMKGVFLQSNSKDPEWATSKVHAEKRFGEGGFKWVENPHYKKEE